MPTLSTEAQNFRIELLNMGGKVSMSLIACIKKDVSATNRIIQIAYDKFGGEFSPICAKFLAASFAWILLGMPENY